MLAVGLLLMTVGPIVGGPLPGPFGIIAWGAGLALVLRSSRRARRHYARWAKRNPRWGAWTNRALRRKRSRVPLPEARQKPYHRPHPR